MPSRVSGVSVALCTFNGGRHLSNQLTSFSLQTVLPKELVVCDDCSSDGTLKVIDQFASSSPFPVRVFVNPHNLRSTKNFERVIGLCNGDVIALSDQDDIWEPRKLETIENAIIDHPDAAFVFSDATIVDQNLLPLGYSLWQSVGFSVTEQRLFPDLGFSSLLRWNRVTGATMAFRSKFREAILPIPREWVHDAWIALVLSAISRGVSIPEKLIRYRQHGTQQIGERRRSWLQQWRIAKTMPPQRHQEDFERFHGLLGKLEKHSEVNPTSLAMLREKVDHLFVRASMRQNCRWRLPKVLNELLRGRYSRYSRGWKSFAQDLLLP